MMYIVAIPPVLAVGFAVWAIFAMAVEDFSAAPDERMIQEASEDDLSSLVDGQALDAVEALQQASCQWPL
jgi:hypothetical protein